MRQPEKQVRTVVNAWRALWRPPAGRWTSISWGWSLLIPFATMLWALSLLALPDEPVLLTMHVESQVTSERLAGATVVLGKTRYVADEHGEVRVEPVSAGTIVRVSAEGHETMQRDIPDPGYGELTLSLSGVLVVGKLVDAFSDHPVEGAELAVIGTDGEQVASSHTDEHGNFIFKFIPEDADLLIRDDVYGESIQPISRNRQLLIELIPPPVTGRVVDGDGLPVSGVEISGSSASTVTDRNGQFELTDVGQGEEITLRSVEGQVTALIKGDDLGEITIASSNPSADTPARDDQ